MAKLQYWPSTMAIQDLLAAHADLGDGNNVLELLQESLSKTESYQNQPVFSVRFLGDLYTRLAMSSQVDSTHQASLKVRANITDTSCVHWLVIHFRHKTPFSCLLITYFLWVLVIGFR